MIRAFAFALAFGFMCGASASAQAPVEVYGNLPAIADAALSPDGAKVALAMFEGGQARVAIFDLNQQRYVRAASLGENQQLRSVAWADDDRVAIVITQTFQPHQVLPYGYRYVGSPRRVDFYRTAIFDVATGQIEMPTTDESDSWRDQGATLIAPIAGDPGFGRLIGRAPGSNTRHVSVYRVDMVTGRVQPLATSGVNPDTLSFVLDEAGAPLIRSDSDMRTNRWRVFIYENGAPHLLAEGVSEDGEPPSFPGLLADGRLVSVGRDAQDNFWTLSAVRRGDGGRESLFSRDGADVDGIILDPWTRRVVGARWTDQEARQHFFEPDLEAARAQLAALGVDTGYIVSWSRDRNRFLVFAEFGLDGGGYYIFDRGGSGLSRVGLLYPALADHAQGERQAINYPARDGVRIPAYLTYPPGENRRNLPLVLFPHGGPHARDTFSFDYWAAFMASRGYAVLQPNFRGSSGYGDAWEFAGRRQWGGLMQTDIEDGVAALARAGIIDPARVCIVGGSYGGYAALAGATLTPDRYKCAVSVAGVSDLEMMLRVEAAQTGGDRSMTSDFWRLSIGDREEDRAHIRAVSPANLVANVRIPILLIHGADDTVVPIDQSRRMLSRLREAGKDVRFVELRRDDHHLSDAETRIQTLREIESFLAENLQTQ